MALHDYGYVPQAEEDSIHNVARLLSVEARPFQRLTSRLLNPEAPINSPPILLPTPPPDASAAGEAVAATQAEREKQTARRETWRQEMLLDFAAFDSSIIRMQLICNSNQKERERYAAEKTRILDTAQAIRENTVELRAQLGEAQKTLALRKTYDALAEKITKDEALKPREDQHAALEKLRNEIEELQRESAEYAISRDRKREQFGKIMDESRQMLKLIKDEKEEAERKEGMDGDDDVDDGEGSFIRSTVGTPRPDMGGATPMHSTQDSEKGDTLAVPRTRLAALSRGGSRATSPSRSQQDTDMEESGKNSGDAKASEESEMEEGEEEEDAGPVEDMDMS